VLAVLLDLAGGTGASPSEQYEVLLRELGEYRPELLERPRVVVGSRADVAVEHLEDLAAVDERYRPAPAEAELDSSAWYTSPDAAGPPVIDEHDDADEQAWDLEVSAITGDGLPVLVGRLADAVRRARDHQAPVDTFVVHRPVAQGYRVERQDDGSFEVIGREAVRAVALSDLTNLDALDEAHARLKRLGIDKALARAGAAEGDLVRIGGMAFKYEID
jgi:GTP-binding protein